jgi:hypothetical protein
MGAIAPIFQRRAVEQQEDDVREVVNETVVPVQKGVAVRDPADVGRLLDDGKVLEDLSAERRDKEHLAREPRVELFVCLYVPLELPQALCYVIEIGRLGRGVILEHAQEIFDVRYERVHVPDRDVVPQEVGFSRHHERHAERHGEVEVLHETDRYRPRVLDVLRCHRNSPCAPAPPARAQKR